VQPYIISRYTVNRVVPGATRCHYIHSKALISGGWLAVYSRKARQAGAAAYVRSPSASGLRRMRYHVTATASIRPRLGRQTRPTQSNVLSAAAEFLFCKFRKFREFLPFLSNRQSESPLSRCFGSHQEICPVQA
jgi:hypothetical protein